MSLSEGNHFCQSKVFSDDFFLFCTSESGSGGILLQFGNDWHDNNGSWIRIGFDGIGIWYFNVFQCFVFTNRKEMSRLQNGQIMTAVKSGDKWRS